MIDKDFNALWGLNGVKAAVVISLSIVGIYAAKKVVDKFCASSIVINSKGSETSKSC